MKRQILYLEVPLYSVRQIEARRIFNLIQQNVQVPKTTLTKDNIKQFLQKSGYSQLDKAIKALNIQGSQISEQNFAYNIAILTKDIQLRNSDSIRYLYERVKDLFYGNNQQPRESYQEWDIQGQLSNSQIRNKFNDIVALHRQKIPYLQEMEMLTFESNSLNAINYCFAIINLNVQRKEKIKLCEFYCRSSIMNFINKFTLDLTELLLSDMMTKQNVLAHGGNVDRIISYLNLMTHYYNSCRYKQLRQKLIIYPPLFSMATYNTILQALINIPQVRIQRQICICLSILSKYSNNQFNRWLLSNINDLMPILQAIVNNVDQISQYYFVIFLSKVVKSFIQDASQYSNENKNDIVKVFFYIQRYSFWVLKNKMLINQLIQKQCLNLIAWLIIPSNPNNEIIEQIIVTTKIFSSDIETQCHLAPPTLKVLQNAIRKNYNQLVQVFLNSEEFLSSYIANISNPQSPLFYNYLHLSYILSVKNSDYLLKKQILFKMLSNIKRIPLSTGVQILSRIIQNSLQKQQNLKILYKDYGLFNSMIAGILIQNQSKKEQQATYFNLLFNNQLSYISFDKSMVFTILKTLYLIATKKDRKNKDYSYCHNINVSIFDEIQKIITSLLQQRKQLAQVMFREKINNDQLCKLLYKLLNQMTYASENKPLELLKKIDQLIKFYGRQLLQQQILTLHQLQVQQIPLYISIRVQYKKLKDNRMFYIQSNRVIPFKFDLSSFKMYLKTLWVKDTGQKQSNIKDVIVKYKPNQRTIDKQIQYKQIISKGIAEKNFLFQWEIVDVVIRKKRQVFDNAYGNNDYQTRSMRGTGSNMFGSRITQSFYPNPYSTTRFTPLTHNTIQRSTTPSTNPYHQRSNSPHFGQPGGGSGGNRNMRNTQTQRW